jgi:ABC-type phosphate transport system substrate-binding protein
MEEVAVEAVNESTVAVINDDSTEVGYVHFGVVHVMQVADEKAVGRRSGILGPEFIPAAEAVKNAAAYESWSRLCLEHLELLLAKASASAVTASGHAIDVRFSPAVTSVASVESAK